MNCYTVFYVPIAGELNFLNADVSLITTIRMLFLSAGMLTCTALYRTLGFRKTLILTSLVQGAMFALQYGFNSLHQFLIVSAFIGYASGCMVTIPASIMINNWFSERKGLFLGVALAASGVVGAIYSPACSMLIERFGWRTTMVITGMVTLLVNLTGVVFFCKQKPESEEQMYGNKSEHKETSGGNNGTAGQLAIAAALMVVVMATQQLTFQFSLYARQLDLSLTAAALLNTACMIGNTLGKVGIGYLKDRIGSYKTVGITIGLIGMALIGLATGNLIGLCAGIVGMAFALGAIIPSFVAKELFADRYGKVTGLLSGIGTLFGSLSGYVIGYLSDVLNGYSQVFMTFATVVFMAEVLVFLLSRKGSKAWD